MGFAETMRENLRLIVDAYCRARGQPNKHGDVEPLALSKASKIFYGNAGFLESFFSGEGSVSVDKYDAMIEKIREGWPEGAKWPDCKPVLFPPPPKRRRENFPVESAAAG